MEESQYGVKKAVCEGDDGEAKPSFQSDVRSLVDAYGPLFSGKVIEVTLQKLLLLCPRKRKRSDAYKGLIRQLGEEGVTLYITSNKKHGET